MAVCTYCRQEMTANLGCTLATYDDFPDDTPRQRIRRGAPGDHFADIRGPAGHPNPAYPPEMTRWPEFCHDCAVPLGAFHHPGCDSEACPGCGGQAIACDCTTTGEDDEDELETFG